MKLKEKEKVMESGKIIIIIIFENSNGEAICGTKFFCGFPNILSHTVGNQSSY